MRYSGAAYTTRSRISIGTTTYCVIEQLPEHLAVAPFYKAIRRGTNNMVVIRTRPLGPRPGLATLSKLYQVAQRTSGYLPHVLDYGRSDRHEYLVVEWVDGLELQAYLNRQSRERPYFAASDTYRMVFGLALGLQRLHGKGVVHGDLKPDNVVVASRGRLVMIDFGSAWFGARTLHRTREGSIGYSPPEQWRDSGLTDHRSDQFATSVMLYQLLTGEMPYGGVGGRLPSGEDGPTLVPPSRTNPQVWRALDKVVMRGLALDATRRYQTTQAWVDDLRHAAPSWRGSRGAAPVVVVLRRVFNLLVGLWERVRGRGNS